ncbi:MAG: PEP-CTERM sorting domain-containing protein [Planctomycetes bacterium]|nr:PEP-CTERM sorting domain-containing protein [Planctomycetota bacterium]
MFGSVSASSFGTVDLVRIDLSTGAATVVGQPVPQADARALAFIPEPGTGVLLALASLFLAGRRSRTCGSTLREAGGDPPP